MDSKTYLIETFQRFDQLCDDSQYYLGGLYKRWLQQASDEEMSEINAVVRGLIVDELENETPVPKGSQFRACFD